jgi:hypothetical protein
VQDGQKIEVGHILFEQILRSICSISTDRCPGLASDGLKSKEAAAFLLFKVCPTSIFWELMIHLFGSGSSGLGRTDKKGQKIKMHDRAREILQNTTVLPKCANPPRVTLPITIV